MLGGLCFTNFTGLPLPKDGLVTPLSVLDEPVGRLSSLLLQVRGCWYSSSLVDSSDGSLRTKRASCTWLNVLLSEVTRSTMVFGLLLCFCCKLRLFAVVMVCLVPLTANCGASRIFQFSIVCILLREKTVSY